jgi:hypothetical protein
MMNYNTAKPNPRFWVLKLLKDNFGPGDHLVETTERNRDLAVQAFSTSKGKKLLVINKRSTSLDLELTTNTVAVSKSYVAPSTKDGEPATKALHGAKVQLEPFEVAVVKIK